MSLICLLTVEFFSLVLVVFFGYSHLWSQYPTYLYWGKTVSEKYDPLGPHYIDTDAVSWGTWHIPNSTIRHKGPCYDVLMHFNAIGARGPIPKPADNQTTIFLGDSFIEGFGLAENETICKQYAEKANSPVLNLGGGGSFGSTQMALIYDSLAGNFGHSKVVLCLYLSNDFIDDDINQFYPGRYRPYRIKSEGPTDYQLKYKQSLAESIAKPEAYKEGHSVERVQQYSIVDFFSDPKRQFTKKLPSFFYTPRLLAEMYYRAKNKGLLPNEQRHTKTQRELLYFNIRQIAQKAEQQGATLYITNIPSKHLFQYYKGKPEESQEVNKLLSKIPGIKYHYIDLMAEMQKQNKDYNSYFFNCDEHFNPYGAKTAGRIIADKVH